MGAYRQFIAVKTVPNGIKTQKFPCDFRTGVVSNAHDPAIWTDAQTACNAAATLGPDYHVGFVFTVNDPLFFIDIDNCLTLENTWTQTALDVCAMFPGAAVEISQSGRGLHIFGTGTVPAHGCKNTERGLEFYTQERFVLLSGTGALGDASTDHTAALDTFTARYFSLADYGTDPNGWTDGPCEGWNGPDDDLALLVRMLRSVSGNSTFGGKASFRDLWDANTDKLSTAYPDSGGRAYDESSADAALAAHLAFWTGKDCERIQGFMKQSGLVRPKYDREDYLQRTILNACARQRDVLTDKQREVATTVTSVTGGDSKFGTLVLASEQREHFKGVVYVTDVHRALVPSGAMLKADQFQVVYGGNDFSLDLHNEKITNDAWQACMRSKVFQIDKVRTTAFKPHLAFGDIVPDNRGNRVNIYRDPEVSCIEGDVTPFTTHLSRVLPVQRDRDILLAYMAAIVQHKGKKFQWCPLIQGCEGNGKSLFSTVVSEAVGVQYSHWPSASEGLTEKFNAWLFDKIVICVEDVYTPDHKSNLLEVLKPMITGERLAKRAMNTDQVDAESCANFILNSNHKDAIKQTGDMRRICTLFTAQQEYAHIGRDGMDGDYFPNLYKWLRNGGFAHVTHFLSTYAIPDELNPAVDCQRAPVTSTTHEAIAASLGSVEQLIVEAVELGLPGFKGDWISSVQLSKLLDDNRMGGRAPINRRKSILSALGYDPHPGLKDGRTDNPIAIDGNSKPRLYLRRGSILGYLRGNAVTKQYVGDQDTIARNVNTS